MKGNLLTKTPYQEPQRVKPVVPGNGQPKGSTKHIAQSLPLYINSNTEYIMDQLPQRKIKIGTVSVGLIGLEVALNKAISSNLSEKEALDLIYDHVKKENYIPETVQKQYRDALRKEYKRLTTGGLEDSKELIIRILGPGCVSCNKLNTMIFDIMQRRKIAADIRQIHDLDEIWRHGVITTPALIINGDIKCAGRMPSPAEVEQWLLEEADRHLS